MKLWALSDLHVDHGHNGSALETLGARPDDWLLAAGDIADSDAGLVRGLQILVARFGRVVWVPGNHELWTTSKDPAALRGVARYEHLVRICRDHGVLTPEDPWPVWPGDGPPTIIAPTFTLYDYSFAPAGVGPDDVAAWAREDGIVAADERLLHPDPYPSRAAWCHARIEATEPRLAAVPPGHRIVLVNHWTLRHDLVRLYAVPRYTPWCGTKRTEQWHTRFPIHCVVTGHLHMRATDWRDGVRFEEVALGYPRHWSTEKGVDAYLREILPGPGVTPPGGWGGPIWHR